MWIPHGPSNGVKKVGSVKSGTYQCTWNITDDGKGMLNGTLRIFINQKSGTPLGKEFATPARGEKHPFDERLYCISSQVSFGNNDIAFCDADYIGLKEDPAHLTFTLNCQTEETDIQLHPLFLVKKDGFDIVKTEPTDDKPAVFDTKQVVVDPKTGDFDKFAYNKDNGPDGKKRLYGVSAFKDPRATLNVSFKTQTQANWAWITNYMGQSTKTVPFAPDWSNFSGKKDDKRNWLLIDGNVSEETGVFNVSVQFALSGPAGWNPLVYKEFTYTKQAPKPAGATGAQWR